MGDAEDPMGINEKIEILSTDDSRIKAVGELLSSDSSRTILKLLFNESMTANQIAQKTEISLPLVMYHLKKMQDAQLVKISQTSKNTKSHDMKHYTVDKFAIVILPSGLSEKAKSSKSLFNSFNRIYRFATIGGVALTAWFSSQFIQQNNRIIISDDDSARMQEPEIAQSSPELAKSAPVQQEPAESAAQTGMESFDSQYATQPADMPVQSTPAPTGGEAMMFSSQVLSTGEPATDIYVSIIITLSVAIVGLIIERIIRSRK